MNTIFITGATRGIGRETALLFARRGWRVFGCGRDEQKIAEVNEIARKENLALEVFQMDVTKREEIDRGMARLMEATGGKGVDVLVNNAGYQELCPVEDLTNEKWHAQFETNFFAYLEMIRRLAPKMREQKRGRIINLSSIAGRMSLPVHGPYAATKHAVEAMSDALRIEIKPFGVRVVLIEPGPIVSNINQTGYANLADNRPAGTVYAHWYDTGPKALDWVEKHSFPTMMAAETVFKAATATHPRQRYGVSSTWWLVVFAKKFFPGWLLDTILNHRV
jgi:NAD(P)-dependent dehydrogenase (short-subunit alcohol dehydrogenase family)